MSTRPGVGAPLWLATFLAATGGAIDAFAFPGFGFWPLIFVGTPLVLFALVGRHVWGSVLVGLLAGFAFWLTHITWITVYLGPAPWLALGGLEAIFYAMGCVLIASAWRFGETVLRTAPGRLAVMPAVVGGLWTCREFVSTTWPYGGFSWGRLSFSQSDSPLREIVSWVGVAGLSFLIAAVSALAVQVFREGRRGAHGIRGFRMVMLRTIPVVLVLVIALIPAFPVTKTGSARIAAVQGNSNAGLFASYIPGQILGDHLNATEKIFGQKVDLVVWPENASDLDPLRYRESAAVLDRVSKEMGAPVIVGTITQSGSRVFNSLLLWKNESGALDQYDKIHPVPFAEYIPDRSFWYPLAPQLLSLIPQDFTVGTRDNLFTVAKTSSESFTAGLAICFDIVDDSLVRQMIDGGADVIVAPTNNADFGRTDESVQQLAIARLRALETGRSVVNTSTVGTSAIIAPDGRNLDELPTFTPGTMVRDVPLSTTRTAASVVGQGLEIGISLLSLLALVALGVRFRQFGHPRKVPRG